MIKSNHSSSNQQGERGSFRITTLLGLFLLFSILLMVNYLSYRHYERWDITDEQLYTLSQRTEVELKALHEQTDLYLFLSAGERNYPEINELLERYKALAPTFVVHELDPDRDPVGYETTAQRFGVRAAMGEAGETQADVAAVLTMRNKRWSITRDDLIGFDYESFEDEGGPKVDVTAEQAITGAIVQLKSGRATKLCISEGHGEWTTEGGERSLYAFIEELRRDNVEPFVVNPRIRIDDDCDALFVVGPLRPFTEDETENLARYYRSGRGMLLALDPMPARNSLPKTGLESFLSPLGIRIGRDLVLEQETALLLPPGNPMGPFIVVDYQDHPVTRPLALSQIPIIFALTRSLSVEGNAQVLFQTSERSWGEVDLGSIAAGESPEPDGEEAMGPIPLGAAVEEFENENERGSRLVVLGDSDVFQPEFFQNPRFGNLDLAMAITGWLTERETLIAIAPKQIDAEPMLINEEHLSGLGIRLLGMIPGAVLVLGVAMAWYRRQ